MENRYPGSRRSWVSGESPISDYDIESQRHRPRGHGRRRGQSAPHHEKNPPWVEIDGEEEDNSPKYSGRHHRRSRSTDNDDNGRGLMLGFLYRGRGLVDLDRLRWARQSVETGKREKELEQRRNRQLALREDERQLQLQEARLSQDYLSREAAMEQREREREARRRAEDRRRQDNNHRWDILLVRRANEDWRRSNEDARRQEEDREWHLWLEERRAGDAHRITVTTHDSEVERERPGPQWLGREGYMERERYRAEEIEVDRGRRRSRSRSKARSRSSHAQRKPSTHQSQSKAFEMRSRQVERRNKEDHLRRDEDDIRREEDLDKLKETRRREDFDLEEERGAQQGRDQCLKQITDITSARGQVAERWIRLQTQWQKLLVQDKKGTGVDEAESLGPSVECSADTNPPNSIALMHRHGDESTRAAITFILPQHKKADVYRTHFIPYTTSPGMPSRTDAWLVKHIQSFYSKDVKGQRGLGLHSLNTIVFAKFVRFERRKRDHIESDPDEFSQVLNTWTCTAQQFFMPLSNSSSYGKFRWILTHHEEEGIAWTTELETLMKQVRSDHDVRIVIYLYESLDYRTATIGGGLAILIGIAVALVYGILKRSISTAIEMGAALTGLLGLLGGLSGWANQFGRESPATPLGASYAYDTTCRIECIERDGRDQ